MPGGHPRGDLHTKTPHTFPVPPENLPPRVRASLTHTHTPNRLKITSRSYLEEDGEDDGGPEVEEVTGETDRRRVQIPACAGSGPWEDGYVASAKPSCRGKGPEGCPDPVGPAAGSTGRTRTVGGRGTPAPPLGYRSPLPLPASAGSRGTRLPREAAPQSSQPTRRAGPGGVLLGRRAPGCGPHSSNTSSPAASSSRGCPLSRVEARDAPAS